MSVKNLLSLLFLCLCLTSFLHAQSPSLDWLAQVGGDFNEKTRSSATDASGNIYLTGYFTDSVDFDPGPNTFYLVARNVFRDAFIQKLDAAGNFLWAKSMGGLGSDEGRSIATDAAGNVYVTGSFELNVDFDPGVDTVELTSLGSTDIFILKLDPNGDFAWVKQMGGAASESSRSLTLDATGAIYTTGFSYGTADFDPGAGVSNITPLGEDDVFIQKLDANGNFLWVKQMGGVGFDAGRSITSDPNGNIYIAGFFQDTADFDPGTGVAILQSVGDFDIFVQSLDANGNFNWVKQFGGVGDDRPRQIITDVNGDIYLTGDFENTVDFDPGPGTNTLFSFGENDGFIEKLDATGNFLNVVQIGGTGDDEGMAITSDANGNVFTTGYFEATVDFDPGSGTSNLTSNGAEDIFIQQLNSNGDLVWAEHMGGNLNDGGQTITSEAGGVVYVTGFFKETVDFGIGSGTNNLSSNGFDDVFVLKLSGSMVGTIENTFTENIQVYPNPCSDDFVICFDHIQNDIALRILTTTGQLVESKSFHKVEKLQVNFDKPPGIYLIEVQSEHSDLAVIRLVKE